MAEVQVKTRLTLDDQASSSLDRIRKGFLDTSGAQQQAQSGMGFFKQTLSTFAAFSLGPMIGQVKQFGAELIHAAEADERVTKTFAGLAAAVQDIPWDQAMEQGQGINDMLDDLAVRSGQSGDALAFAYQRMVEIGGGTEEAMSRASGQVEQLSKVSSVLGKDVATISSEFAFMGEGILRTRGPLFQLLQKTGIFGKDVRGAALAWSKMSEQARGAALAKGLEQVHGKLKNVPQGMDEIIGSFREMAGVIKETIGLPIVEELAPVLEELRSKFFGGREEFERMAHALGHQVGEWVKDAAHVIEDGFHYIELHGDEIRKAFVEGAETAKKVVEFILAHKEEIAIAFGAKMAVGAAGSLIGGAKGAIGGGMELLQAGKAIASYATGLPGLIEKIAVFGAAKTAGGVLGPAMSAGATIATSTGIGVGGKLAVGLAGIATAAVPVVVGLAALAAAMAAAYAAYETYQAFWGAASDDAMNNAAIVEAAMKTLNSTYGVHESQMEEVNKWLETLRASGDEANVRILEMAIAAKAAAGALEAFDIEADAAAEERRAAEEATQQGIPWRPEDPPPPNYDFRGSKFEIKQDFRDQDPDRVAAIFQKDIERAVVNRSMSSRAFGLGF